MPAVFKKSVSYLLNKFLALNNVIVVSYNDDMLGGKNVISFISGLKDEKILTLDLHEAAFLNSLAKSVGKIKGDFAEVGVYKGGSAKVLCSSKGDKNLFLFDTFEGLPKPSDIDKRFWEGEYKASLEEIKHSFRECSNAHFIKGVFPGSARFLGDRKFSLVHLDVDLYKSVYDSLDFFYARMNAGGIILSHDFQLNGVRKAFEDFFKNKPETVIGVMGSQCIVVKL